MFFESMWRVDECRRCGDVISLFKENKNAFHFFFLLYLIVFRSDYSVNIANNIFTLKLQSNIEMISTEKALNELCEFKFKLSGY